MAVAGDFSFMDHYMKHVLEFDYRAVSNIPGAWEALRAHDPDRSFVFETNGPIWDSIKSNLSNSHSSSSLGISLRNMEYIAKHGWEEYVKISK